MTTPATSFRNVLVGAFALCFLVLVNFAHAADAVKLTIDVPADVAEKSLKRFSEQTGHEVIFPSELGKGVRTKEVKGEMTAREALDVMLADTGLVVVKDPKTEAFSIRRETPEEAKNGSSRPGNGDRAADGGKIESGVIKLETFEVMGTKLLNMDIKRSRDDAQPYVIFDRQRIEQSQALSIGSFLKQRLPMSSTYGTPNQTGGSAGNLSSVNLRGLGTNQTLVLLDGHRMAGVSSLGSPSQSNLNSIPISAVERIEVLPIGGAAIYGGGATGGAINVVLRHDYAGSEVKLSHENTFDTDSAVDRMDLNFGFNLDRKTNVLVAASGLTQNDLKYGDRDFLQRARARVLANTGNNYQALNVGSFPPLGSTTNILSTDGSDLVLKSGASLNSPITYVPVGYLGRAAGDGGTALVANAGKYNLAPANTASTASGGTPGARASVQTPVREISATVTVRRQWTERIQTFLDAFASNSRSYTSMTNTFAVATLPATAPTNPFAKAITIWAPLAGGDGTLDSTLQERRLVGGFIAKLPGDWQAEVDYTWDRYRNNFMQAPTPLGTLSTDITNGTLDVLRDTNLFPLDISSYLYPSGLRRPNENTLKNATARVSGTALNLPAGALSLSGLVEHRGEHIAAAEQFSSPTSSTYTPARSQSVDSAYLEAHVPLIAPVNQLAGARELELQLSGRVDQYKVNGVVPGSFNNITAPNTVVTGYTSKTRSANPLAGLSFRPTEDIMLRASYSTGFLPPTVTQVSPTIFTNRVVNTPDPFRGNTAVGIVSTQIQGGNPDLKPEHSTSRSIGVVLTPRFIPGLRLSVDWIRTDKRDEIKTISEALILANPDLFPGRVVRGPNLPGDQPGWLGPVVTENLQLANIARSKVEAYDVQLDYHRDTQTLGVFDFFLTGTVQPHYLTQTLPVLPLVENVGISNRSDSNVVKYRSNAGVTWGYHAWTFGWVSYYYDSYFVADPSNASNAAIIRNQGNGGKVPHQIYHDAFVGYRFPRRAGSFSLLANLEIQAGFKNVFNTKAPVDLGASGTRSYFADPRGAVYYLSLKKFFN